MSQPNMMKAVAIDRFGGVDELKLKHVPTPKIDAPDEVLIRIEYAGVGVWDPIEREGEFAKMFNLKAKFPYVIGSEGAGDVIAAGEGVSRFKPGTKVYAAPFMNPKGGFYGEYAVVKADAVSLIPQGLSVEQAAAFAGDAGTALRGLDEVLQVKAGETVLIFGAGGGLGHLAVQLAKRLGAKVFAVASGEDGVALAKQIGADAVVNGRKDDIAAAAKKFASNGIDAALFTAGGEAAKTAFTTLRKGARAAHPNGVQSPPSGNGIEVKTYDGNLDAPLIKKMNQLIESQPGFTVHVAKSFPLEQAADAHRMLDTHYLGKIALKVKG